MGFVVSEVPPELLAIPADTRRKVQEAIAKLEVSRSRSGKKNPPPVREVRAMSLTDTKRTADLCRAHRLGRMPDVHAEGSWTPDVQAQTQSADEFIARVKAAAGGSDDERAGLQHEIAALVLAEKITPQQANVARQCLSSATSHKKVQRDTTGGEDVTSYVLTTPESYLLVRAFDGIVSESRRQQILETVISEAETDMRENPSLTEAD